eukprot:344686-Chlamydomonas_euryale.AAC.2
MPMYCCSSGHGRYELSKKKRPLSCARQNKGRRRRHEAGRSSPSSRLHARLGDTYPHAAGERANKITSVAQRCAQQAP